MAVHVKVRDIAVLTFPHKVGHPTDAEQIGRAEQRDAILEAEPTPASTFSRIGFSRVVKNSDLIAHKYRRPKTRRITR